MKRKTLIKSVFSFFLMVSCWMPMNAQECPLRGDVNLDGTVGIDDLTCLINYLLTKEWPAIEPTTESFSVNGVSFKMIAVQGGTFSMGATFEQDSDAYNDEKPAHEVTLSSYCIGETEVTQALWLAVMGTNPSYYTDDLNRPVEQVSWNACQQFITKLNQMTGKNFRLPTEAEWEYAARGGKQSQNYKYAGSNSIGGVAWYASNASTQTQPVAMKVPNELGLYDMSGNVCEWCQDWYNNGYNDDSPVVNPTGPESGSYRVIRGGCFLDYARSCRVSSRSNSSPSITYVGLGLRLAL